MSGSPFESLKCGAVQVVKRVMESDSFSDFKVVFYNGSINEIKADSTILEFENSINKVKAGGSTNFKIVFEKIDHLYEELQP